jgi:hypothetical protein
MRLFATAMLMSSTYLDALLHDLPRQAIIKPSRTLVILRRAKTMAESLKPFLKPLLSQGVACPRNPLSARELDLLESKVGVRIPKLLRQLYGLLGLAPPPLVGGEPYMQLYENVREIVAARRFIEELLGDKVADLFPFADDGAGNYYALLGSSKDDRIRFIDHEVPSVTKKISFLAWLHWTIKDKLDLQEEGTKIDARRVKYMDFWIYGRKLDEILAAMSQCGAVGKVGRESKKKKIPRSQNTQCRRRVDFDGLPLTIVLTEYATDHPHLHHFYLSEPCDLPKNKSIVRQLDQAFAKAFKDYHKAACDGKGPPDPRWPLWLPKDMRKERQV